MNSHADRSLSALGGTVSQDGTGVPVEIISFWVAGLLDVIHLLYIPELFLGKEAGLAMDMHVLGVRTMG